MIYIILIAIALALIAAAVTCQAVWYRRKWKEENSRRWQETSIMLSNEKELNEKIQKQNEYAGILVKEYSRLQSKLSAILCPTNNHVWKDGRCVKCGRVKDG